MSQKVPPNLSMISYEIQLENHAVIHHWKCSQINFEIMEERKARLEGVIKIILKACLPNLRFWHTKILL